ncbi:MAG: hypothetical protein FWD23_13435 [Oscillospiraceae bacterium]|nr:hypothetical protein [Oscillospiraceae bacterium]
MLKLTVDLWASSMEIMANIIDNITGKSRLLRIVFDTGAYMTVIHDKSLLRAGYNVNQGRDAEVNVVGRERVPAKEILLKGFELIDIDKKCMALGPVLVYATDMSNMNASAVLGLNVIREFETKIKYGKQTIIELEPAFDTNDLVRYESFSREHSRFGLWVPSQVTDDD